MPRVEGRGDLITNPKPDWAVTEQTGDGDPGGDLRTVVTLRGSTPFELAAAFGHACRNMGWEVPSYGR
jgi:hypothetical protein